MNVLVAGGAGYIGGHMVMMLRRAGHDVTVLDDLSAGHRDQVIDAPLIVGDVGDRAVVEGVLGSARFDAVMHFAAKIRVDESVRDPAPYYGTNVAKTITLLEAMRAVGVSRLVFSSTAAVYGEPRTVPITEDHPRWPTNPYGRTKSMIEDILADYHASYGLSYASFRYFNAAGADPDGRIGERHEPETHLIPIVLEVARGRRSSLTIHGDDWPTLDGTCVRDYVHVVDLCAAHLAALSWIEAGNAGVFNLGSGRGHSIREVVAAAEEVTGRTIPCTVGPRRRGDPAVLVASADRARSALDWRPTYPDLHAMVAHAWAWEQRR